MKKKCFKCRQTKELCEFYKHNQMADGYFGKCKECARMDATNHRNANLDHIRSYDRKRGKLPHRIKMNIKNTKKRRKRHPLQYAAHILLGNAIRSGKVTKSSVCEDCGATGRIHGHHEDYCKLLDVVWLCTICHNKKHKKSTSTEPPPLDRALFERYFDYES